MRPRGIAAAAGELLPVAIRRQREADARAAIEANVRDFIEERAAIIEADGVPRELADALARERGELLRRRLLGAGALAIEAPRPAAHQRGFAWPR